MPCLTLFPAPECGFNGECADGLNGTKFCRCAPGWTQSLEMNYFVDEDDLSSGICSYSKDLVTAFYSTAIILAFISNILHLVKIRNMDQLKRRSIWISCSFLMVAVSSYRLINEDALLGVDFTFSFAFAIYVPLAQVAYFVFLVKYFDYMNKKAGISGHMYKETYFKRAGRSRRGFFFATVLCVTNEQLIWVATFTEREVSLILFRTALASIAAWSLYRVIYFHFSITALINDMEEVLDAERSKSTGMDVSTSNPDGVEGRNDNNFIVSLKERIPKLKGMKTRLFISGSVETTALTFGVFLDFGFICWTYLLPLCMISLFSASVTISISKWNSKNKKRSKGTERSRSTSKAGDTARTTTKKTQTRSNFPSMFNSTKFETVAPTTDPLSPPAYENSL